MNVQEIIQRLGVQWENIQYERLPEIVENICSLINLQYTQVTFEQNNDTMPTLFIYVETVGVLKFHVYHRLVNLNNQTLQLKYVTVAENENNTAVSCNNLQVLIDTIVKKLKHMASNKCD